MAAKTKWLNGSSGAFQPREGSYVLKYDAWDTDPVANKPTTPGALETKLIALEAAVYAAAPADFLDLYRSSITISEADDENGHVIFDVNYSYTQPEATRRWSFDTSGGTTRIFTSLGTQSTLPVTAPDYETAINVSDSVEGVDITIPSLKLTCTYRHAYNSGTVNAGTIDAYIKTLASLSGTINNGTILTYAAGELLFLGASGEYVPDQATEIQYQFAASANVTGLTIGNIAGTINKRGHDYLWVKFEDGEDGAENKLVKKPLAVYVEKVYTESDFGTLGIF